MAIAHDSTTQGNGFTPLTFSHTVSGTDTLLVVFATANSGQTITGVTYNGVSMTQKGSFIQDSAGPKNYCFYLVNPATGANNVVVTASSSVCPATAISYTGVDQTTPIDAYTTTASAATTSYTSTITTNSTNSWVVASSRTGNGFTLTAGANTVLRQQPELLYLGAGGVWDSGAARSSGSNSVNVTSSIQLYGGAHVLEIKEAGGVSGYANKVMGVVSANIGKVMGVATANISKVMGA